MQNAAIYTQQTNCSPCYIYECLQGFTQPGYFAGGGGGENFLHGNYSKLDVIIISPIVANIWGGGPRAPPPLPPVRNPGQRASRTAYLKHAVYNYIRDIPIDAVGSALVLRVTPTKTAVHTRQLTVRGLSRGIGRSQNISGQEC